MGIVSTLVKWLGILLLSVIILTATWLLTRPSMAEVGIPYAAAAAESEPGVTVKWFGVTTLLIDDGETQLMTDGFFSRPSLLDILMKRPISPDQQSISNMIKKHNINRLAAVIPVHSHYDHAMDSGEVAKQTGALLLGSSSTSFIGRSSKLPESQIQNVVPGQTYSFGQFKVTLFESKHTPVASNSGIDGVVTAAFDLPAPYTSWQLGKAFAILIEHPQSSFLVQGSAGFMPGAFENLTVDAVFLGTGGLRNQPQQYRETYVYETVTLTAPEVVYTIHHDNLFGELGNVDQSSLLPAFDALYAFELSQLILPARFEQMRFAQAVSMPRERR